MRALPAVLAVALTLAGTGVAVAQSPVSTPAPLASVAACVQASLRVSDAGRIANNAADALATAQGSNAALQTRVDDAVTALDTATAAVQNATAVTLPAAQLAAVAARAELTAAIAALVGVVPTSAQKSTLVAAQAKLLAAIDATNLACAPSSTATPMAAPTTSATPTSVPVPLRTCAQLAADGVPTPILIGSSQYNPANDSDQDGIACESNDFPDSDGLVRKLPVGGVDTGWVG